MVDPAIPTAFVLAPTLPSRHTRASAIAVVTRSTQPPTPPLTTTTIIRASSDDTGGFTSADITDDHAFRPSHFPKRATFRTRAGAGGGGSAQSAVILHHHVGRADVGEARRRTRGDLSAAVMLVPGAGIGAIAVRPAAVWGEAARTRHGQNAYQMRKRGRRTRVHGEMETTALENQSSLVRIIEVLQSLGLSIEDAGRVVQRRPDLLEIDPEKDLTALKLFLKDTPMNMQSNYHIGKVIRNAPGVFGRVNRASGRAEIRRRLDFLQTEIRISPGDDLADVISKRPHLMWMDLQNARAVMDWLQRNVGVEENTVAEVLRKVPHVMLASVTTLSANVVFMKDVLGLQNETQRGRFVVRYPQVLCLRVETMMKRIDYFKSLGVTQVATFKNIVEATPEVLEESIDLGLKKKISVLHRAGLGSQEDILNILSKAPAVFNTDMTEHFDWLKKIGLSDAQVKTVVRGLPAILIYSIPSNLEPKWMYMQQVMKGTVADILDVPLYFAYNLEQRVMPRVAFVRSKELKAAASIPEILNGSDKQFCRNLGFSYEEFRVFEETGGSMLFHSPMM